MHLLCQQSEEVLFGHFMSALIAAFESKLPLEDEDYESGNENFNIPTTPRHTPRIHHVSSDNNISFNPTTHATQVPASHATNQYDAGYPSVALMMKTFLQLTFHHLPAQYHCGTPWIFHNSHIPSAPKPYVRT